MRRNWPDLLIGLALVAVIAGIVATLLTGGSFFPRDGGAGDALVSDPPAAEAPADAGAATGGGSNPPTSGGLAASQDPPSVAVPASPDGDATGLAAPDPGPPGAPDPDVAEGNADDPAPAATSSGADDADEGTAAAAPANVQPLAPGDPVPAATTAVVPDDAEPAPAPAASPFPGAATSDAEPATSEADGEGLPTDPYRVSVGAFGSPENAERQAATFREAGYPVFVGRQDDLSIVLVGPYDQESAAERVADEIRAGDFDIEPVIYRYEPDEIEELAASASGTSTSGSSASGASTSGASASAGATSADEAPALADTDEDAPATPVATGTPLRLQVGAYANVESAQPQIDRLEGLGLTARTVEESGLVKLLVGPLEGEELEDARVVLEGAGMEFFARP